jgi:geranylgeranyl pyrophosphate synthase
VELIEGAVLEFGSWLVGFQQGMTPADCESMGRFGRAVGTGARIASDTVALLQGDSMLGHRPGQQLREGVYTIAFVDAVGCHRGLQDVCGSELTEEQCTTALDRVALAEGWKAADEAVLQATRTGRDALRPIGISAVPEVKEIAAFPHRYLTERLAP